MKNSRKIKCKVREMMAIFKRSPGNNQDGVALVTALLFLNLLSLLTIISSNLSVSDATRTEGYKESREAFYIADSGIEHAKSVIKTLPFDTVLAAAGILDLDGPGDAIVNFVGGSYSVVVTDNNDGDGNTADDSDGIVIITSTATTAEGTTKTIVVVVQKNSLGANDFPAAVTLADSDSEIETKTNSFLISGSDSSGNGWYRDNGPPDQPAVDPACAGKNGIVTNDNAPDTSYIPASGVNKIQGIGGTSGDIVSGDTSFTDAKLQAMRNTFLALPKVAYTGDQSISSGSFGSSANPQVTYFDSSAEFSGNVQGAGVLIVNEELEVKGNFTFEGIILVGICSTCQGEFEAETGNSKIYGAVVVSNPTLLDDGEAEIEMSGNAAIYYSCQAINNALGSLLNNTFSVISWSG